MNTSTSRILKLLVLGSAFCTAFATRLLAVTTDSDSAVAVFIIDDQSGEELRTKHGIQPLQVDDLIVLVNAVMLGTNRVHLVHQAVDDDATDNAVAQMVFKPFSAGSPPIAPKPNIPLRQFVELAKQFQSDRATWQHKLAAYRKDVELAAQAFVQAVGEAQMEVAQRFDRILEARNGRDFNRSDIAGCVIAANRILGNTGRRVLILNTDAEDLPGKREPRRTPLAAVELDPAVTLIFVNTSRLPEQSALFAGVQNPLQHANSIKEAMEIVVGMLGSPNSPGKAAAAR